VTYSVEQLGSNCNSLVHVNLVVKSLYTVSQKNRIPTINMT